MPLLDPRHATPVIPQRDTGSDGNIAWQNLPATKVVMRLDEPIPVEGKGSRYTQKGKAFIPRGYDLKHGDRIPFDGAHYTVVGRPRGNHNHPITGDDFGWVVYTVQGGG